LATKWQCISGWTTVEDPDTCGSCLQPISIQIHAHHSSGKPVTRYGPVRGSTMGQCWVQLLFLG